MSKIFVAGLVNLETATKISCFPICESGINYKFFGVNKTISKKRKIRIIQLKQQFFLLHTR